MDIMASGPGSKFGGAGTGKSHLFSSTYKGVLLGPTTPHWTCSQCGKDKQYASRLCCSRCGCPSPPSVSQKAWKAAAEHAKANPRQPKQPKKSPPQHAIDKLAKEVEMLKQRSWNHPATDSMQSASSTTYRNVVAPREDTNDQDAQLYSEKNMLEQQLQQTKKEAPNSPLLSIIEQRLELIKGQIRSSKAPALQQKSMANYISGLYAKQAKAERDLKGLQHELESQQKVLEDIRSKGQAKEASLLQIKADIQQAEKDRAQMAMADDTAKALGDFLQALPWHADPAFQQLLAPLDAYVCDKLHQDKCRRLAEEAKQQEEVRAAAASEAAATASAQAAAATLQQQQQQHQATGPLQNAPPPTPQTKQQQQQQHQQQHVPEGIHEVDASMEEPLDEEPTAADLDAMCASLLSEQNPELRRKLMLDVITNASNKRRKTAARI